MASSASVTNFVTSKHRWYNLKIHHKVADPLYLLSWVLICCFALNSFVTSLLHICQFLHIFYFCHFDFFPFTGLCSRGNFWLPEEKKFSGQLPNSAHRINTPLTSKVPSKELVNAIVSSDLVLLVGWFILLLEWPIPPIWSHWLSALLGKVVKGANYIYIISNIK